MTVRAVDDDALDENLIALLYDAASGIVAWSDWGEALRARIGAKSVVVRASGDEAHARSPAECLEFELDGERIEYVAPDSKLAIDVVSPADSRFLARSVLSTLDPHFERLGRLRNASDVALADADVICDEFGLVRSGGSGKLEALRKLGCLIDAHGIRVDLSRGRPSLARAIRRAQLGAGRSICVVENGPIRREIEIEIDEPSALIPEYRPGTSFRIRLRECSFDAEAAVRCLVGLGVRYTDSRIVVAEIYDLRREPTPAGRIPTSSAVRDALGRAMRAVGARDVDELAFVLHATRLGERWRSEFEP